MKSKVDPAFWRRFNALPLQVQQLARNAFALWLCPLAPARLFCFRQFFSERLVGGLGLVLLIEDQGRTCAFEEIGNP